MTESTLAGDIQRKRANMEEMTPFDITCTHKGNPFIGDCPQQTMENVCGVLRVLEGTTVHEPECGYARHERQGWSVLFSGLANALHTHVEHMEGESQSILQTIQAAEGGADHG